MRPKILFVLLCLCSASLAADETSPRDLNDAAEASLKAGDYQGALQSLESLEEMTEWRSLFLYGTAQLMAGQLDLAAEMLDRALGLEGQVAGIWVQRAIVEQERGHPETALRLLKVALELEPRSAKALLNVGYAYESLGRLQDARVAYGEYLRASAGRLSHIKPRRDVVARMSAAVEP